MVSSSMLVLSLQFVIHVILGHRILLYLRLSKGKKSAIVQVERKAVALLLTGFVFL